jgi:glycosyltransferase involved in cell wall biosynthesis
LTETIKPGSTPPKTPAQESRSDRPTTTNSENQATNSISLANFRNKWCQNVDTTTVSPVDYRSMKTGDMCLLPDDVITGVLEKLREIDYIWVPSKWQMEVLIDSGINPNKISVVNLSLDPDKFFPIEKKNEKLTLLHIGTWGYRKSSYEIMKTFLDIFSDNDDVELRVSINNKLDYQDGPIETFEKFGLPLNKNIKILGTLSEDEYVKEIQNADLYISCSRGEGWNLPLIQSMACGVPSIYSRSGGQLEFSSSNLGIKKGGNS